MPTRFYLPNSVDGVTNPQIYPEYSGLWEKAALAPAGRAWALTEKVNSGFNGVYGSASQLMRKYDVCIRQYISYQTLRAQEISGTIKGQIRCSAGSWGSCMSMVVKVVSQDGTELRGILYSIFPSDLLGTTEWDSYVTNKHFPESNSISTLNVIEGDRIAFELGFRTFNDQYATGGSLRFGCNVSVQDLPENEESQSEYNPWIEFSQTLTLNEAPLPESRPHRTTQADSTGAGKFDFMYLSPHPYGTLDNFTLNPTGMIATQDARLYWFFRTPEPITITHLGFMHYRSRGTPFEQRASIRRILSDGTASNVVLSSNNFSLATDGSDDNTFKWVRLLNPYTAGRGESLCAVLEPYSGYVNTNNYSQYYNGFYSNRENCYFPYYRMEGSAWGGGGYTSGGCPIFAYKSSSRVYGWPVIGYHNDLINYPKQVGLRLMLKKGFGKSFKIAGVNAYVRLASSANQSIDLVLYEGTKELNRTTFDTDMNSGIRSQYNLPIDIFFDDASLSSLTMGRVYYLVFSPNQADTNFCLTDFEVPEITDMMAFPGSVSFYLVDRANPTLDWTHYPKRRPIMDLYLDDWTS